MTIKQFDKPTVRALMAECAEALQAVADKHGLKLERKSCSYSETECPVAFKLRAIVTDDTGDVVTPEALDFKRCAAMFGLKPDDLGREFVSRGKRFKVAGVKPRNRKYPIIAKCVLTGKTYKFPEDVVIRALAA